MAATTLGRYRCAFTQSSSSRPTMAAGMQPMSTMPHSRHVPLRSSRVFLRENGFSFVKYRMMTAMMAPIWMTTRNSARNCEDTSSFTNASTRIIWPVDEMGSHSVMPSTTPMKNAFNASMSIMSCSLPPAAADLMQTVRF